MSTHESADIVSALHLEQTGPGRYRGLHAGRGERDMVFGGSLLAQLSVAAARSDPGKVLKSSSAIFSRRVLADVPVEVVAAPVHVGRVFSSVRAAVLQDGQECASALVLLTLPEEDLIRHGVAAPDVGDPLDAAPRVDNFPGRESRSVGGIDIMDADSVGDPELALWVRYPSSAGVGLIERQALVAHASVGFVIGTAMRPHDGVGQSIAHRGISTGVIAHTMSFHEDCDPSTWMLVSQESPYAGRGRAYGRGHVFSGDGAIVASFSQESMIRHFPEGHSVEGREASVL